MKLDADQAEKVLKALRSHGFALEWETAKIFENLGFFTRLNFLGKVSENLEDIIEQCPEIDVIAAPSEEPTDKRSVIFFVECKSSEKNGRLILLKSSRPETHHYTPLCVLEDDKIFLDWVNGWGPEQGEPTFLCDTGYFFIPKDKGDELVLRDQTFYKGIRQLTAGMDSVLPEFLPQENAAIMPLIVTDAEIFVSSFADSSVHSVPWARFRNQISYTSKSNFVSRLKWRDRSGRVDDWRIPAFWVVRLQHLTEFIEKFGPKK